MKVLRGHQNWVYGCAFSPDSSVLCSVGASKAVCVRVPVHYSCWIVCIIILNLSNIKLVLGVMNF